MDIKNLQIISEAIALDNSIGGFKPEFILPFLKVAVNKFVILLDSRYGDKAERIRLVSSALDDSENAPPFMISLEQWAQVYEEAVTFTLGIKKGKLIQPLSLTQAVIDFYVNGYDEGKTFPSWPGFSEHYRVAKKEMTVVSGIPGHGKSEFVDAIAIEMAVNYKWKLAVFSPENYPYAIHCEKLLSKMAGKPFHQGPTERMRKDELAYYMSWIQGHFVFIEPAEDALHLDAVLGLAQKAIDEYGVDGIIVDPWNEIEHNRPDRKSETDYIGESLMKCRRFARRQNVAFWIVAHPSKQYKDKESGEYSVPSPYDISGSAHWRNKADNCLCVFRNQNDTVTVHIQKIKFKIRGRLGSVNFFYDKINGRYREMEVVKSEI